jgi:aminomethyltransferase
MKKTIFNELHKQFGAKMVEFAGFEMPIQYKNGIIHEHKVVREKAGVFDVSHMGEFDVQGPDALAYVQKITVNDASKLVPGKVQYSAMTRLNGCIVDDLLVYCLAENHYMLVVNGANVEKDYAWCKENTKGFDVKLNDISDEINLLAVQGPESMNVLQELTDTDMSKIAFYTFVEGKLAGVDMIISRTGYTGELGYELYFRGDFDTAKKIWDSVFAAGEKYGIEPVGLGCRDTLRLEKCYMLYGNDIDETTNPIEAGLGWITKLAKGPFNGSDVIAKVKEEGPTRKLVGFLSEAERFIPRHGYKIYHDGKEVGYVTSGNMSPSLGKPIALGYVPVELAKPGTKIEIEARKKFFTAEIVKTPFL